MDNVESVDNLSTNFVDKSCNDPNLFMIMTVSLSKNHHIIHRVWIMWITYPQILWISEIHRFFRIGMWITFCLQDLQIKVLHKSSELSTILAGLSTLRWGKFPSTLSTACGYVDKLSTISVEKSCSDIYLFMTMTVSLS